MNIKLRAYDKSCISPSRGWYSLFPFELPQLPEFNKYKNSLNEKESLCLVRVNLKKYKDSLLDDDALAAFEAILKFFADYKKEMILRVVYDDEGNGLINEPNNIELIINHMSQLGGIVKKYSKYIYTTQGLFIGNWGEMHTSAFLDEDSLSRLLVTWYRETKGSVRMAVRKPMQLEKLVKNIIWMSRTGAVITENKITENIISESEVNDIVKLLGLFNDALTASDTDYGTYEAQAENKEKWINYQNRLCNYVYNGGEVFNVNLLNNGVNAIEYFKNIHISYLNSQYDASVIDKWKKEIITIDGVAVNAYEYISSHLGYRLELKKAKLNGVINKRIKLELANTGFASVYFPVRFVILYVNNGAVTQIATKECDSILPGQVIEFNESFSKNKKGGYLEIYAERLSDNHPIIIYN